MKTVTLSFIKQTQSYIKTLIINRLTQPISLKQYLCFVGFPFKKFEYFKKNPKDEAQKDNS